MNVIAGYRELMTADLIPAAWRDSADIYVFNPAVIADGDGMLAFYRVVRADLGRRIAACRLDADGVAIPGSAIPFSDMIRSYNPWYADPRAYLLGGKCYVYWNTGYPEHGDNQQFLIEVDRPTLRPVGGPIEMMLDGTRQRIEKNWILFEQGADLYAIYSISPHRILRARDRSERRIVFEDAVTTWWDSIALLRRFGPPRGGAQPVANGAYLYHFCHASSGYPSGSCYVAQCYEFENRPPFRLTRFTFEPLPLPNPRADRFVLPKLNKRVTSVVYPSGNIAVGKGDVLVSYGVNDEAAFVATIPFADIDRALQPVRRTNPVIWRLRLALLSWTRRIQKRLAT
ncbi:hypothetical protein U1701_17125 [Sphingomonas sp. PB2P19]